MVETKINVESKITLPLEEEEARALVAISVYGYEAFLEYFYKNLGTTYLKPHEKGLVSLFKKVSGDLQSGLNKIDFMKNKVDKINHNL